MGTFLLTHFLLTGLVGAVVLVAGAVWVAKTPPGPKRRLLEWGSTVVASFLLLEAIIGFVLWVFSFF